MRQYKTLSILPRCKEVYGLPTVPFQNQAYHKSPFCIKGVPPGQKVCSMVQYPWDMCGPRRQEMFAAPNNPSMYQCVYLNRSQAPASVDISHYSGVVCPDQHKTERKYFSVR